MPGFEVKEVDVKAGAQMNVELGGHVNQSTDVGPSVEIDLLDTKPWYYTEKSQGIIIEYAHLFSDKGGHMDLLTGSFRWSGTLLLLSGNIHVGAQASFSHGDDRPSSQAVSAVAGFGVGIFDYFSAGVQYTVGPAFLSNDTRLQQTLQVAIRLGYPVHLAKGESDRYPW